MLEKLKPLSPLATDIFESVYKEAEKQDNYYSTGDYDSENPNEPFSFEIQEGLVVEDNRARIVVMSQYWICNGDLMSDPCMRFLYLIESHKVYPLDFQMDGVIPVGTQYDVAMQIDRNTVNRCDISLERELADFSQTWLCNVYCQFHEIEALAPELKPKVLKTLD